MSAHAILAPSGMHRWGHCTPSARLALSCADTGSTYAAEGTVAHALAEVRLAESLKKAGYPVITKDPTAPTDSEFYGREMEDYIEGYVTAVHERVAGLSRPTILLEERVDFEPYVPESFGTADVIILSDGVLEVIDLKYGKGVPVDAHENWQLMLYGLGAFLRFDAVMDLTTVRMTIIQPRLDSVSTYELSADALLSWAENTAQPAAQLAWAGEGEFRPGEWCRFCPAKSDCRARAEENLQLMKEEFAMPPRLSDDEIAELLPKIEALLAWGKDVQDYAFQRALEGVKLPGWKLVEGRSKRIFTDEGAVYRALHGAGLSDTDIYKQSLRGITELTKMLGKKRFEDLLGSFLEKPAGKPVLVPESDRRPALEMKASPDDDFTALDDNDKEV